MVRIVHRTAIDRRIDIGIHHTHAMEVHFKEKRMVGLNCPERNIYIYRKEQQCLMLIMR